MNQAEKDACADANGLYEFWDKSPLSQLAKVAKAVSQIPPTSATSESLFSQLPMIVTPRRRRLTGSSTEVLLFLKGNLKALNYDLTFPGCKAVSMEDSQAKEAGPSTSSVLDWDEDDDDAGFDDPFNPNPKDSNFDDGTSDWDCETL